MTRQWVAHGVLNSAYLFNNIFPIFFSIDCSEKGGLEVAAAEKIKQLTAELGGAAGKGFDPIERIRTGFEIFKKEKYE